VSASAGSTEDPPFEEVPPIQLDIKMDALEVLTEYYI
jgi:hypothetical protein